MSVVGVFEQNQTAVRRIAAFSGEVERVSEVIEQVHGLVYPLEAVTHCFAQCPAFSGTGKDLTDGFSGAGCDDTCLCSRFMIQSLKMMAVLVCLPRFQMRPPCVETGNA